LQTCTTDCKASQAYPIIGEGVLAQITNPNRATTTTRQITPSYSVLSLVTDAIYSSMSRNISNVSCGLFLFGCIIEVGETEYKKDISKTDIYRKSQDSNYA